MFAPPILLAAGLGDWFALALFALPVLAILYRLVIGDQDAQSRHERRRADQMDEMLDSRRPSANISSNTPRSYTSNSPVEAEIVETRSLSSRRSDREQAERVPQDQPSRSSGTKVLDEIEKKFEKRHVGHLSSADDGQGASGTAPEGVPLDTTILQIHPSTMWQAFMLREIMRRPEW